jgi:dihydroxyacetone kinase-like protein
VTVADDVALASDDSATGRRGIAGTVLVHKLAGAAAEEGKSLEEVTRVARRVAENVRTMGVALSPCIVPAVGKPTFTLPPNGMPPGPYA